MEEIKIGEWARTTGGIIQRVTKIKKCEKKQTNKIKAEMLN